MICAECPNSKPKIHGSEATIQRLSHSVEFGFSVLWPTCHSRKMASSYLCRHREQFRQADGLPIRPDSLPWSVICTMTWNAILNRSGLSKCAFRTRVESLKLQTPLSHSNMNCRKAPPTEKTGLAEVSALRPYHSSTIWLWNSDHTHYLLAHRGNSLFQYENLKQALAPTELRSWIVEDTVLAPTKMDQSLPKDCIVGIYHGVSQGLHEQYHHFVVYLSSAANPRNKNVVSGASKKLSSSSIRHHHREIVALQMLSSRINST